ncbi:MAG: tetratricopeptide repeat protein [Armatimonadia bacterium]
MIIRQLLADFTYELARASLSTGRWGVGHAHRLLRLTVALWPGHPQAAQWLRYLQGRMALERGNPELAIELLREADRGLPEATGVKAQLGLAYTLAGENEQAIAIFERAAKEEPAALTEDMWGALAWSYLSTGRAPKAREACVRADELEVHSPRLVLLHRLATGVGLGSLPVSEIRELLQEVPHGGALILDYARLQAREGRHRLARAAVSALPDSEQARSYSIIANASLNDDDTDTAAWAVDQVARTKDESYYAEVALVRSEVSLRRGDLVDAFVQAKRAVEAQPKSGRAHEQAGRVLLLSGRWEDAVDEMVEALHTGQAGALAAGIASLAAMEVDDVKSARGVFLAARYGDGLACATSHVAQARVMVTEKDYGEALQLASWGIEELLGLEPWARRSEVIERLTRLLRSALQTVRDGGSEAERQEAERLLGRMEERLQ